MAEAPTSRFSRNCLTSLLNFFSSDANCEDTEANTSTHMDMAKKKDGKSTDGEKLNDSSEVILAAIATLKSDFSSKLDGILLTAEGVLDLEAGSRRSHLRLVNPPEGVEGRGHLHLSGKLVTGGSELGTTMSGFVTGEHRVSQKNISNNAAPRTRTVFCFVSFLLYIFNLLGSPFNVTLYVWWAKG